MMNDNESWPRLGQAGRSHILRTLAKTAGWQLTEVPADLGLPLAACLCNEPTDLLVTVTDEALAAGIAAMDEALINTRSDGLIVRTGDGDTLPDFALGIWRSGIVTWHWRLGLWASVDGDLWVVPKHSEQDVAVESGFRLTTRHLRIEDAPWQTVRDRDAGFVRAKAILSRQACQTATVLTSIDDRS